MNLISNSNQEVAEAIAVWERVVFLFIFYSDCKSIVESIQKKTKVCIWQALSIVEDIIPEFLKQDSGGVDLIRWPSNELDSYPNEKRDVSVGLGGYVGPEQINHF